MDKKKNEMVIIIIPIIIIAEEEEENMYWKANYRLIKKKIIAFPSDITISLDWAFVRYELIN